MQARNRTRRASSSEVEVKPEVKEEVEPSSLETFLNLNANNAFKRPWHRLERGLRLNRIRMFINSEKEKMHLSDQDTDHLTNLLHRSLQNKQLNTMAVVIYNQETEQIQEIKGLVYHTSANGRILSQIVDKRAVTFRKGTKKSSAQPQE